MFSHLKGIGVDNNLRVHFLWDAERQKIVVGYCGAHLEKTPCLQAQFSSTKKSMGRRGKNEPSPRDVITKALLDITD
jgi:hypothetical protein